MAEASITDFVSIEAKVLAKAMKFANAIVEVRNTIPVLNTVKLTFGPKGLVIGATDLDILVSIEVDEIDGAGEWSTCIAARDLANVAAAAGTTPLRIAPKRVERDNGKGRQRQDRAVEITVGEASYDIPAVDAADFPELLGDRMQRIERFTNGQFPAMLKKVSNCISTKETRYYLNGINWSAKPQGKRLTATDGHRLATCRYDGNETGEAFSYILPRKTVSVLTTFLDGADIEIFSIGKGNAIVETMLDITAPAVTIRTKLIDGTYPDFDRVIPSNQNHRIDIRREEMLVALRQATAIGNWRGPAIRLHGINGRLHLETKNPDAGSAKVVTSAAWPDGMSEIGFNSRYMADMLKSCQGGEISIGMTDAGAPITLTDEDKDVIRVVMPMRV
ncbi:DNA polymerase III subunit beta [Rhizobium metallidurans]|uniref:Beta sliding clamp n=1 Tax=Rhizobium metallidurans TaxID=1265931 RepID=A0A7W6CTI1_9HYPH|nr:DNA polymerase III subunit beta [Rhizobium metallidurans]MBB3965924.1 DNA polymerase-3 subunit beta [Rhizobium metallidurans]